MKKWSLEKFNLLLNAPYVSHIHTTYSDGESSLFDYVDFAIDRGIKTIIFTDHVRKKILFDFNALVADVRRARIEHPQLNILIGAEAKILPEGQLDIPAGIIPDLDVLCIACHSFPKDAKLYFKVLNKIFKTDYGDLIRIWVHPGLFFLRHPGLIQVPGAFDKLEKLIAIANGNNVFGETNFKYNLPDLIFPSHLFWYQINGFDAHHVKELEQYLA